MSSSTTSPSSDYVSGPEHPPSPDYVHGPEYPEYVALSDDEILVEDQPLPVDASPTALSSSYIADSDPEEDFKEDPADYPAEEASEEDEDEDEDEHLASADSAAARPQPHRSPRTKVPFSKRRLRRARKTIILQPPMAASTEALIVEFSSTPTTPSPPPSPLSPWLYPLLQIPSVPLPVLSPPLPLPLPPTHTSPTCADEPLGYRATMIRSTAASPPPVPSPPLLLPSADRMSDIPKTDFVTPPFLT
nr:hypothetical protein [Tanacetum cinerariifolium]